VIAGHVHLTKIARAIGSGVNNVHAEEKRLSRHLDSEHWSMRPVIDGLLHAPRRESRDEMALGLSKRFVAAGPWKTLPGASSGDFTWKNSRFTVGVVFGG